MEASPSGADGVACSVLFRHPARAHDVRDRDPDCFRDLNLDQVAAALTRGREEYDLAPFFRTPLRDPDEVVYRQEVFGDLEDGERRAGIDAFAARMRTVRRYLSLAERLRHRHEKESWFLHAGHGYVEAVEGLAACLDTHEPGSRGLRALRTHLARYVASTAFRALKDDTAAVLDALGAVRYCVHIAGQWVTVTRYEEQPDYSRQVASTFARFEQGRVRSYLVDFFESVGLNHVEADILDRVARLHPEAFAALERYVERHAGFPDATVTSFDREVQLYLGYLDLIAPLRAAGLPLCQPEVRDDAKDVHATDAYDIALAAKLVADGGRIVPNDFVLSGDERVLVVTGANQGGKTTFARMVGQLHHLAAIGLSVPGRRARTYLFDEIFTHFTREERLVQQRGGLQDDLLRIRHILDRATARSMVIMNEIFGATTLADARALGVSILGEITALDALGVYVTFVDELASFGPSTVSMVSTVDTVDPSVRTFKVRRRPADGLAHAVAIAERHQLTYERLRERIGS